MSNTMTDVKPLTNEDRTRYVNILEVAEDWHKAFSATQSVRDPVTAWEQLGHVLAIANVFLATLDAKDAAISALKSQLEWQPIETAPKDGTKILLGRFSTLTEAEGFEKKGHIDVDWWRRETDKRGYIGFGHFNPQFWPPTHWMPLPKEPTS